MQKALEYAIKSVTAKRQTEHQIREKLSKRFPEADQEAVIARLKELDYVNDKAFSEAWVNYRSMSSPRGSYVLRRELKQKGVQEEDMQDALEAFKPESVLRALAEKHWQKLQREPNRYKRKQRLLRFLTSRGFALSDAIDTANQLAREQEE